jgi:hypothetical protein
MGLSAKEIRETTESIAQEWLRVQRLICAHKRGRDRNQRASDFLNWGTVIAAVITAASAGLKEYPFSTVFAGVVTAALATSERVFAPTRNIQSLWKTQKSLEASQRELLTFLQSLPNQKNVVDAQKNLARIADTANDSISAPVSDNDHDRGEAERNFRDTVLYFRLTDASSAAIVQSGYSVTDVVMGDDALDVIAVTRKRRP